MQEPPGPNRAASLQRQPFDLTDGRRSFFGSDRRLLAYGAPRRSTHGIKFVDIEGTQDDSQGTNCPKLTLTDMV
jgi:hypothetical protein